jgi:hypothetical protein
VQTARSQNLAKLKADPLLVQRLRAWRDG